MVITKAIQRLRAVIILSAVISLALCTVVSCREKPLSVDEIYKKDASGVVLIVNRYYFSMNIGGSMLYFTGVNADGTLDNLTNNVAEITRRSATLFGTGFFISGDGNILTNRHVARPEINKTLVRRNFQAYISATREYLEGLLFETMQEYNALMHGYGFFDGMGYVPSDNSARLEELRQRADQYREAINSLYSIDLSRIAISTSCRVSVAYNGRYSAGGGELHECEVTKVSGIDDVDLAVVQLKDKKTPENRYVFHFLGRSHGKRTMLETAWRRLRTDEKARQLKVGTKLCMIGFNYGPDLAQTSQGIQAQVTTGDILQTPDNNRLMYSVPVLLGSSGSPVLNMYNDVVAVNFAKAEGTTNFNFGIPVNRIKEFLGIDE